jgi:hypothetical protein
MSNKKLCAVIGGFGVVVATTVAVSATGASSTLSGKIRPVRYSRGSLRLRVSATAPAFKLRAIVERYGGQAVRLGGVRIGGPPPGWKPTEDGTTAAPPAGLWVYITVPASGLGAPAVRPVWEANLVVAALRDEVHATAGSPDVVGSQVSAELPSGVVEPNVGGGVGDVMYDQAFSPATPGDITHELRARAAQMDLRIRSIDVLRPLQAAPAVVATTSNPEGFIQVADGKIDQLFGGLAAYEGEYLEVRDSSGSPIFIQASSFRTGVGQRWIRPDLDPRKPPTPPAHVNPAVG